jgi:predicted nucleotidyltransferase
MLLDELKELQDLLQKEDSVYAMWLEGSLAEGYDDEYSDIDMWLDVDDDKARAIYGLIEDFLESKGPLDMNFDGRNWHPKIDHKTYHIAGRSPYEILEVNIQYHSRDFKFVDGVNIIKVLFDKAQVTKKIPLDKTKFREELEDRKQFLLEKIKIGQPFLEKQILRNTFLEALLYYNFWFLEPVVELARIKYSPTKISFGLKHISRDLPQELVQRIEDVYKVQSLEEIKSKVENVKLLAKELT